MKRHDEYYPRVFVPDISDCTAEALDCLCEQDRRNIERVAASLSARIRGLGEAGALELLYRVGRFLNERPRR